MSRIEPAFGKVIFPQKKGRKKQKPLSLPLPKDMPLLVLGCCGFFFGRLLLFGQFNPMGTAWCAAFLGQGTAFYLAVASVFLGYTQSGMTTGAPMYLMALSALGVWDFFLVKKRTISFWYRGAVGGGALVLGGVIYAWMEGGSLFLMVRGVAEGALALLFGWLFCKGQQVWRGGFLEKSVTGDDLVAAGTSLLVLLGGVMASGPWGETIALTLAVTAILAVSYRGGSAGVAVAAVAGLSFLAMGEGETPLFLLFVLGALSTFLFHSSKRLTVLSFGIGATIAAFYLSAWPKSGGLWAVGMGMVLFLLLPQKVFALVQTQPQETAQKDGMDYYLQLKDAAGERFAALASAFSSLASIFQEEPVQTVNPHSAGEIVDAVAARVCQGCGQSEFCWKKNSFEVFSAIHRLCGQVEEMGKTDPQQLSPFLKRHCVRLEPLRLQVEEQTRFFQEKWYWQNRLAENRSLLRRQLETVAQTIASVGKEVLPTPVFFESTAKEVKKRLEKQGLLVQEVLMGQGEQGLWVLVRHPRCMGKHRCMALIAPTVAEVTGKSFVRQGNTCPIQKDGTCLLMLQEEAGYTFQTALSRLTKAGSTVSGDTAQAWVMEGRQGVLALSDGMGSGEAAAEESKQALDVMKAFLQAGFPMALAAETINGALASRRKELFSTLDVCTVDLRNGQAEVMKNGGATVFLRQNGRVRTIRSTSLPMGVVGRWQGESTTTQLHGGDVVLLLSDGVTDALGEEESKVVERLMEQAGSNLSWLCDALLQVALQKSGGEAKDDMTAIAGRLRQERI